MEGGSSCSLKPLQPTFRLSWVKVTFENFRTQSLKGIPNWIFFSFPKQQPLGLSWLRFILWLAIVQSISFRSIGLTVFLNLGRQQSDTPLILGAKILFANSLKSLENFCLTIDISNNGLDPFCRTDKTFPHLSLSCIWAFWIGRQYMFYVLYLKLRHRLECVQTAR